MISSTRAYREIQLAPLAAITSARGRIASISIISSRCRETSSLVTRGATSFNSGHRFETGTSSTATIVRLTTATSQIIPGGT